MYLFSSLRNAQIKLIYEERYKANRMGRTNASAIAQKLERWMHLQCAKNSPISDTKNPATLEIGAGTLNHIPYEDNLSSYDIVEPMPWLFEGSASLSNIRNVYSDIGEIPDASSYSRIISIAVLEHLTDLPKVIARSINLLRKDGVFSCGIPSEGGFLWGFAWRMTTGLEFRLSTGLNYGDLMITVKLLNL